MGHLMKWILTLFMVFVSIGCSIINTQSKECYTIEIEENVFHLEKGMPKSEVLALFGERIRDLQPKAPGYLIMTRTTSYRVYFKNEKLINVEKGSGLQSLLNKVKEK
jgi:hypothetical protein